MRGMDAFSFLNPKNNIPETESIMNNKQQGMTLVELMVTVAVLAILASVAAPSIKEMMENNRLTAINNQIVSALNYTRSEAIKRAYPVAMCAKQATDTCATAANSANGTGFEDGWIIFIDCDKDFSITTTNVCDFNGDGTNEAPETILVEGEPSSMNSMSVTSSGTTLGQVLRYQPNGKVSSSGTLPLDEYDLDINIDNTAKYKIKIAPTTGRVKSCKVGNTGC